MRIFSLLVCWFLSAALAMADLPFRNHRANHHYTLPVSTDNIVFIGNSITQGNEWWEAFGNPKILNRGISGALSSEVLQNLEAYVGGKPRKVFLMIGTNDLGTSGLNTTEQVVEKTALILERIKRLSPQTEVYVQSILPTHSGMRNNTLIQATNTALQALCAERNVTYLDVWSQLIEPGTINLRTSYSNDGLHMLGSGYRVWCNYLAPYVGSTPVYPAGATDQTVAAGGYYSQRASDFAMLPVRQGDILMIGDLIMNTGEWHELFRSDKVKGRGIGVGYAGASIAITTQTIPGILKGRADNEAPAKVFLQVGAADATGNTDVATLKTAYEELVGKIRTNAPGTRIYIEAILPHSTAATNTGRIEPLNAKLKEIADAADDVEYIDLYTPFLKNGVCDASYFTGVYLYGKGFAKMAEILQPHMGDGITPITEAEAAFRLMINSKRSQFGQMEAGDGIGQYPADRLSTVQAAIQAAEVALAGGSYTESDVSTHEAAIDAALTEMQSALNPPVGSTADSEQWYQLYTPLRENRYLSSGGAGAGLVGTVRNNYAKSMWKFVSRGDGTWDIVNREDQSFVSPTAGYNTQLSTSATQPAQGWTLSYAATPGLYIVSSGTVQFNQTQSGLNYKVYNWSSGNNGTDRSDTGCQYAIAAVTGEPDEEPVSDDVQTTDELTTGWYRMRAVTGSEGTMQGYITAGTNHILTAQNEYRQNATNYYPLKLAAPDNDHPATAFLYITKSGANYRIQTLNGHSMNENCTASRSLTHTPATISGNNGAFTVDKWSYYNPSDGSEKPYVGKSSSTSHTYAFTPVKTEELAAYDRYTVSIIGAAEATEIGNDVRLTCNLDANKGITSVYANGYFFFPKGTELRASDFTASAVAGKQAEITIEEGTIRVSYLTGLYEALSLAIDNAKSTLVNTLAGTDPGCFAEADRQALRAAINAAEAANTVEGKSDEEVAAAAAVLDEAVTAYLTKRNELIFSTAGNETWYYIQSASTLAYTANQVIQCTSVTDGDPLRFGTKRVDPSMVWCFEQNDAGKIAIRNKKTGRYFASNLTSAAAGTVATPQFNYTISLYDGDWDGTGFTIQSDASNNPIHAQQAGTVIVTWPAAAGNASLWRFVEVPQEELELPIALSGSTVVQGRVTTGIGNQDVPLLRTTLQAEGMEGTLLLKGVKGNLTGTTNLADVTRVKVYSASNEYDLRPEKETAVLLGETTDLADGQFNVVFAEGAELNIGNNYFWVAVDVSEDAKEGNSVDAQITGYTVNDGTEVAEENGNPAYAATIFLTESTLLRPTDFDSRYYRIPAITTAANGWLVAVADKRYSSESDLPNNIDVVAQVSKDNGRTWTEPVVIAGTAALGGDYGHGDPAIVTDRVTGDVIVLVTSKVGFFYGTPTNIPRIKCIISHDHGLTWDAPVDITDQIYGAGCADELTKTYYSGFVSSGAFMQKRDGTLVAVMPIRPTSSTAHNTVENHLILSKDHGKTWTMAHGNVTTDADEAKVVELDNGKLLVSVRHGGNRYYNTSGDDGETWDLPMKTTNTTLTEPACNGDMIRFTSTVDGHSRSRLLHSIPWASSRQNVSVLISYDEGTTWESRKTICPRGSSYSALTILPDGTVGCYYEENGVESGFAMRFVRFSLEWLTDSADHLDEQSTHVYTEQYKTYGRNLLGQLDEQRVGYTSYQVSETDKDELARLTETDDASLQELLDAINQVLASPTEVTLPVAGRAYTIRSRGDSNGNNSYYLKNDVAGEAVTLTAYNEESQRAAQNDRSYQWICQREGNSYWFVSGAANADGKQYLYFQPKAASSAFKTADALPTTVSGTNSTFGLFCSADDDGTLRRNGEGYLSLKKTGYGRYPVVSVQASATVNVNSTQLQSDAWTSDFRFEEVAYPNTVTLTVADDVQSGAHLATFSAPFATRVPDNMTAYWVNEATLQAGSETVLLTPLAEGAAIPAGTGVVLLAGEDATTPLVMAPALTADALTGINALQGTSENGKTFAEGETPYLLKDGVSGIGFYRLTTDEGERTTEANRAYLEWTDATAFKRIVLGTLTGIEAIPAATADGKAPIYDLAGRRVERPVKGIYIRNGQKFIVK